MVGDPPVALYVGPETAQRERRVASIEDAGLAVDATADPIDGVATAEEKTIDAVVVDTAIRAMSVHRFLRAVEDATDAPTFVVGDADGLQHDGDSESAIAPVRYVPDDATLGAVLQRAVDDRRVADVRRRHRALKDAINSVAQTAVGSASPEAIKRSLYANLVREELYQLGWIGDYDRETDSIQLTYPTAKVVTATEIASLLGSDDAGYIGRAVENRAVETTTGHASTRSASAEAATAGPALTGQTDDAGTRVNVAVALHDGDTVQGVLLLSTPQAEGVTETERAHLADLGRLGGTAMAVAKNDMVIKPNEFASMVVHEIRNPLAIARGALELFQDDGSEEYLDRVEQGIDQIEHVLSDELALFRGGSVDEETFEPLADDARGAWEMVMTRSATLEIDGSVAVSADHDLLVRLLANLFDNAITHGGADVTVSVGSIEGGFYVEDDGPGIPEDVREKMFDLGFTSAHGTGLGMAIVEKIVDAHGWDVSVGSSDAGGARFEFSGVQTRQPTETAESVSANNDD